ncbi:MAG: hypothetical protein H0W06_00260 [Chloroflexia bacterium]|nr:hypothetical protein [Chloroflexia bacterium]
MLTAVVPLMPQVAGAQDTGLVDDDTYVFEDSYVEVTWDRPWSFDEENSSFDESGEFVVLTDVPWAALGILDFPEIVDSEFARDFVLGGFEAAVDDVEQIDRGSYDDTSYSLDLLDSEGLQVGLFSLFIGHSNADLTSIYFFFAQVDNFSDSMVDAQENVEIDDKPIFDGVQPEGLQELLDDEADASSSVSSGRDDSDGYYDRTYDYGVEWTGDWVTEEDSILSSSSLTSDADLVLINESEFAIAVFSGFETGGLTPEFWVDELAAIMEEESEFRRGRVEAQIVDEDGLLIIFTGRLDSEPMVLLLELIMLPDAETAVAMLFMVSEQDLEEAVESLQSDITVNGDRPLRLWEDLEEDEGEDGAILSSPQTKRG